MYVCVSWHGVIHIKLPLCVDGGENSASIYSIHWRRREGEKFFYTGDCKLCIAIAISQNKYQYVTGLNLITRKLII